MKEVYVVNCCRTAIGSFGGSLKDVPAAEMGAVVIKEALNRAGVKPEQVDEVMFGCILTAGLGQNVARQAAVKAGIPYQVPAYTVGMVCGSGMKSVIEGARTILAGDADVIVAGGTENMSAAPYALPAERWGARMGDKKVVDTMIKDGLWDAYNNYHMGTTAENICDVWGITRQELDAFGAASQQKACAAIDSGRFNDEIVPVPVKKKKEVVEFKVDEYPKPGTTAESIANRFAIPEEKAAVLYTALFIYHGMLRFCPGAKSFLAPVVDISEAVVRYLLIPKAGAEWDAYLQQSALACAEQTALRFGCDLDHCRFIGDFACKIFDKMKRVHGLDPSKRLILQLAATLHSCGRFVSVRQHNRCTFDLIKGMDIFGLSSSEVLEVAFVAGSISNNLAVEENQDFALLPNEEKLVISKMAAMFRMANALDKYHRAKLRDLKVSMEEDRVIFKAEASGNTLLERWSFRESAAFFTDVFGLSPELTVKLTMLS